jgi:translocation and assembly module TamA
MKFETQSITLPEAAATRSSLPAPPRGASAIDGRRTRSRLGLRLLGIVLWALTCGTAWAASETPAPAKVDVEVSGVSGPVRDNVLASLAIYQQRRHERLSAGRIKVLHQLAPAEIREAMEAFGFYKARITSELTPKNGGWTASYHIVPGPPVRVDRIDIQLRGDGASDPAFKKLVAEFPLHRGDTFGHKPYEDGKASLQRLAAERGYFDARYTASRVEIIHDRESAEIELHFDTGRRYRFGAVSYPQTKLSQNLLQRYQPFRQGDPYDAAKLLDFEKRLTTSDYFSEVSVTPLQGKAKHDEVPVDVTLTMRKRNRYAAGVGYGTDTGPRARLEWQNRYLNRRGHRLGASLKVSPALSSLSGQYVLPLSDPAKDKLAFTSSATYENTTAKESSTFQAGVSHLTTRWGWNETLSLDYQLESFTVGRDRNTTGLLIPSGNWSRVWADNPVYTRRGWRLRFGVKGAQSAILSDISFLQTEVAGKFIHGLGARGRVILRGDIGLTATSSFERLPASLRFFAGGDNSIRGFSYESLGPRDSNDKPVGGRYLAVGSVEYEHEIIDKWSVAGFFDFGNAFNSLSDPMAYGTGVGVRWRSPVGLVRVDLGVGASDPALPIHLHIVVGPDL